MLGASVCGETEGERRNVKCECYCRTLKPVGIAGLKWSICTAKEIIELVPACVLEEFELSPL